MNFKMMHRLGGHSGFSFYEIIVVLLVLSILAIVAVGRFGRVEAVSLRPRVEVLVSHIRYAQAQAMNTNTPWGIRYDASSGAGHYWLFRNGDATDRVVLPGETDVFVELADQGIAISQGSFSLSFDGWGRPTLSDAGETAFSERRLTLTATKAGAANVAITVHENTGYVTWP